MANPVGFSKQFDILKLKDILEVQGSYIGSSTQSVRCVSVWNKAWRVIFGK